MPCDEFLESVALMNIAGSSSYFKGVSQVVGDLGERAAMHLAANVLRLEEIGFRGATHGFDAVYKDAQGRIVIVEAKATGGAIKSPESLLHSTKSGVQMSESWIRAKAELMQDERSSLYTPANRAIGIEILRALDNHSLRSIMIVTGGKEQAAGVFENSTAGWSLTQTII